MTTWPQDHPGRICKGCGVNRYPLWVDPTHPPPGTCPEGASDGHDCPLVRSSLLLGLALATLEQRELHPQHRATMARCGITSEELAAWRARDERLQALRADLLCVEVSVAGKPLRDWLDGEFPEERFTALVLAMRHELITAQADGVTTIGEIVERNALALQDINGGLQDLLTPEAGDGTEGEEE